MYTYSGNSTLDIEVFTSDLDEFFDKKVLYALTDDPNQYLIRVLLDENDESDFVVNERAISQLRFPWDSYGKDLPFFAKVEPFEGDSMILGYDLFLNEPTFRKYVEECESYGCREVTEPFWGRGLQFNCHLDRIHLVFHQGDGRNITRERNVLVSSPLVYLTKFEPLCKLLRIPL